MSPSTTHPSARGFSSAIPWHERDEDLEDPIAICGFALKFPDDATDPESFWKMLASKRNAMSEYPPERLNPDAFHQKRENSLLARGGNFIREDLSRFDAGFFSITPSEAAAMDPMQRLLLETTFNAFVNAGIPLEDMQGSRTSVHTGCFSNDYLQQLLKDADTLPPYTAVGASQSMLANRISWFFDLRGPSVNLDSACSSSAMGIDAACQLLRSGSVDAAVAAGCNLTLDPSYSIILSNMHMLSPDARCYAFDHRANGYARGEGVGVVILKRLQNALQDNDTIRAVIRSSGCNQDGRTPGITQPDRKSQAELIRETYQRAGLSMAHTRFFEAHGTGTPVGDPIEVGAIYDCFHGQRSASSPIYVGSVKTNIGHLEGASGIAGLIKSIIVVESGVIPPNANFERLHPRLAAYSCMAFPQRCLPWPEGSIRRVSINSFGYGGSNCHIVLDDAYSYLRLHGLSGNHRTAATPSDALETVFSDTQHARSDLPRPCMSSEASKTPKLLVWSANSEASVKQTLIDWQEYFNRITQSKNPTCLSDIAYTLDSRRTRMAWKTYAVVSSSTDLSDSKHTASAPRTKSNSGHGPRLAFVFTGQGAQWYAMGRELLAYEAFSRVVDEAEEFYRGLGCSWSVREEMLKDEDVSSIDNADISQSLTAILQIGIVDLLKCFQVVPSAVVGHSMGEIAAAYAAGFLTRHSALLLAYFRGKAALRLSRESPRRGAMLAVGLSVEQIRPYMKRSKAGRNGSLVIACVNSPANVTVSGPEPEIQALKQMLESENIFVRRLRAAVAYHSPEMEQVADECLQSFANLESAAITTNSPRMISTVTGTPMMRKQACDPSYWVDNMLSPVLFHQAIERLCRDGYHTMQKKLDGSHRDAIVVDHLVEIGPHSALRLPIMEILDTVPRGKSVHYNTALVRKQSASLSLLSLLGDIYSSGYPVDIRRVNDPDWTDMTENRISLSDTPSYPFDHSTQYWSESRLSRNYRLREHGYTELLGSPSFDWNPLAPEWRCCVRLSDMPWLVDHKLNGQAIYPAAAMIAMALEAVSQLTSLPAKSFTLRRVQFRVAIVVPTGVQDTETRLRLNPLSESSRWLFTVYSVTGEKWTQNCEGVVEVHHSKTENMTSTMLSCERGGWAARKESCVHKMDSSAVYKTFEANGFHYGPAFQGITDAYHDGIDHAVSAIRLDQPLLSPVSLDYVVHPATLDAFFQLALVTLMSDGVRSMPTQAITTIDRLWIASHALRPSENTVASSAKLQFETGRTRTYSVIGCDPDRHIPYLVVEGLETTSLSSPALDETPPGKDQFWYTVQTCVDVDMLSARQIIDRLDQLCGSDSPGPRSFFQDLAIYIYSQVQVLRRSVRNDGVVAGRPHLIKYIEWMDWQLRHSAHLDIHVDSPQSLRQRIADQGVLGDFFLQVADSALGVLEGTRDIVQMLFETNLVEQFYENQSFGSIYYHKLSTYLKDLSHKYPNMEIMEIGAGTGSFTEHLLSGLVSEGQESRFHQYHYTDISPAFFERAGKRFAQHTSKMAFSIFDAEADSLPQGFPPASLDVIAASNVLHVTTDLKKTLRRLRLLLRPGGKLILHEIVRPESIAMGFVFGLLPGWWPPDQTNSRPLSPVVSESTWDGLLRESGFSGADFVLRDYAEDDAHLMSIMCATAVDQGNNAINGVETTTTTTTTTLLIEPTSLVQRALASELTSHFKSKGKGNSCQVIDSMDRDIDQIPAGSLIVTLFDLDSPILSRLDSEKFESLKRMLCRAARILWVSNGGDQTADPRFGLIHGFLRVFRIEHPRSITAILALDGSQQSASVVDAVVRQFHGGGIEDYTVLDGVLHFHRVREDHELKKRMLASLSQTRQVQKPLKDATPFAVIITASTSPQAEISAIENEPLPIDLSADEVEIDIRFVGPNAPGLGDSGHQYSGMVARVGSSAVFTPGDRVCAYAPGGLASSVRVPCRLVSLVPDSISFSQASTMPRDLLCARLLARSARICLNDVVAVMGADLRIASALLCHLQGSCFQIFASASSERVEQDLRAELPAITVLPHDDFPGALKKRCPGGADIIIDFTNTNMLDLADMIRIGGMILGVNYDGMGRKPTYLGDSEIPSNVLYQKVDFPELFRHQFGRFSMPPLPTHHLSIWRPEASAKLSELASVASAPHNLEQEPNGVIQFDMAASAIVTEKWSPSCSLDPLSSYVIAGGLGDLGRCLAKWMVNRGARHLILLSRSGPRTQAAKEMAGELQSRGAILHMPACDITDRAALQQALSDSKMPPIRGCIQTSAVLKDIMYEKMTVEDWDRAIDPKVTGSWNLHSVLPSGMDFFVLTSSISGILGQATQINYAAANTYQDALAQYRISQGEHAISIDLGILLTGGLLSQNQGLVDRLVSTQLYQPIPESEIIALFDHICHPATNERLPPQIITGIAHPSSAAGSQTPSIPAFQHPFWSLCLAKSTTKTGHSQRSTGEPDTRISLNQSDSVASAAETIAHALAGHFCRITLTPKEKLDLDAPLHVAGADSLTAVDLRNWILKELAVDVPIFDILGDSTVQELGVKISQEWKKRPCSSGPD